MTNIIDKCLEAGLRITNQRRIIIELIDSADDHPDVDTIYRRAIDIDDTISLATIYRTVSLLEQADLIEKVEELLVRMQQKFCNKSTINLDYD